ncbi:MAG: hypothetical protein ACTTIZ_01420 [Treponema sp.]
MKDKFFAKLFATFLSAATILVPMTTIVSCVQQPQQSQIEKEIDASELEDSFTKPTDPVTPEDPSAKPIEVKQDSNNGSYIATGTGTYQDLLKKTEGLRKENKKINTKAVILTSLREENSKTSSQISTQNITTKSEDPKPEIIDKIIYNNFFKDFTNLNLNSKNEIKIDLDVSINSKFKSIEDAKEKLAKIKIAKKDNNPISYDNSENIKLDSEIKISFSSHIFEVSDTKGITPTLSESSYDNVRYVGIDKLMELVELLNTNNLEKIVQFDDIVVSGSGSSKDAKDLINTLKKIKIKEKYELNNSENNAPSIKFADSFTNCQGSRPLNSKANGEPMELTYDELNEFSKRSRWRKNKRGKPGGMLFYKLKITNLNDSNRGDVTFENAYGETLEFVGDKTNLTNVSIDSLNVQSIEFNGIAPREMGDSKLSKIVFVNAKLPDNVNHTDRFGRTYPFDGTYELKIVGNLDMGIQKKYETDDENHKASLKFIGPADKLAKFKELNWVRKDTKISTLNLLNRVKDKTRE